MAKTTIGVSWSDGQGQYRKYVGYQMGRDGKPKPKCWYLGTDERDAVRRAVELTAEWNRLQRDGADAWPTKTPDRATKVEVKDDFLDPRDLTVGRAADLYVASLRRKAEAGQRSWSHVHSVRTRMGWVYEALGQHTRFNAIGETEIEEAVLFLVRRPIAKRRNHQTTQRKPISVALVVQTIRLMKSLLTWVHELDGSSWIRPKRFDKLFRVRLRDLATPEERARAAREVVSGDVACFTADELDALWNAARDRDRLFILLGLNCGLTSSEISDLRVFEVFLDTDDPFIHRRRNKTGVEAKWALWPETVHGLRKNRAIENAGLRWLLTYKYNPLVEVTSMTRRDSVEQAWKALVERAGIERRLGFRFLRKTGADAIKRIAGREESEMYLSHQEPGLNKHYANRDWPKMWAALQQFRGQLPFLNPLGELKPSECLFTRYPKASLITPPFVRKATKRSRTGLPNVSFHGIKKKFYARVTRHGETHCSTYFETAEEAAAAVVQLRHQLDAD